MPSCQCPHLPATPRGSSSCPGGFVPAVASSGSGSAARKGGTRCGQALTDSALEEGLRRPRPILHSLRGGRWRKVPAVGAWSCRDTSHSPSPSALMPGSQGVGGGISIHSGEIKGCVERADGCESADLGLGLALPHGLVTFLVGLGFLTCEMMGLRPVVS